MHEYIGALHIHSSFSDGSGNVKDIALTANEVGLDYIILTDHNTLRALHEGYEGFYGNTFLMVGCEINDKQNQNHYLALGINESFSTRMPAKEYVKKVKESGGIGFLAHPDEKRSSFKEHPPYPWVDWDIQDFDGIEIWNHMSEWMENLTEENKYQAFLHPLRTIVGPTKELLQKWDQINMHRKVTAVGGIDAHAHKVNVLGFFEVEVFPYKVLFKSIRTHILTSREIVDDGSPEGLQKTKKIILDALKYGRSFIANSYHGDAKGFRFFAKVGNKKYNMGDEIKYSENIVLKVLLPTPIGLIKLIRNGELYDEIEQSEVEIRINEPGIFRVEVYINGKAWIFSNHIRIV